MLTCTPADAMPQASRVRHSFGCTDLCCQPAAACSVSRSLEAPGALVRSPAAASHLRASGPPRFGWRTPEKAHANLARSLPLAPERRDAAFVPPPPAPSVSVVDAACMLLERVVGDCCDESARPEHVFAPIFHSVSEPGISGGEYLRGHLLRLGLTKKEHLAEAVVLHAFLLIDRLLHVQADAGTRPARPAPSAAARLEWRATLACSPPSRQPTISPASVALRAARFPPPLCRAPCAHGRVRARRAGFHLCTRNVHRVLLATTLVSAKLVSATAALCHAHLRSRLPPPPAATASPAARAARASQARIHALSVKTTHSPPLRRPIAPSVAARRRVLQQPILGLGRRRLVASPQPLRGRGHVAAQLQLARRRVEPRGRTPALARHRVSVRAAVATGARRARQAGSFPRSQSGGAGGAYTRAASTRGRRGRARSVREVLPSLDVVASRITTSGASAMAATTSVSPC
jgi:hypothetical protein